MAMLMAIMIPSADAQIAKYYPSAEVKAASNIPRFSLSGPVDRIDLTSLLSNYRLFGKPRLLYFSGPLSTGTVALGIVTLFL